VTGRAHSLVAFLATLLLGGCTRSQHPAASAATHRIYDHYTRPFRSPALAHSPLARATRRAVLASDRDRELALSLALVDSFPLEHDARLFRALALLDAEWEPGAASPGRRTLEASVEDLARVDPASPWPQALHALVLARDGQVRGAVEEFSHLLIREDLTPAARGFMLSVRGQAYRDLGQLPRALADLEEAARLDPTNALTFVMLADALAVAGHNDEALGVARHAVMLTPDGADENFMLGWVLGREDRWKDALAPLTLACRRRPTQSFLALRALAFEQGGEHARARRVGRDAEALPESDWGRYQLARYYAAAGERTRALARLRRSLELGYLDPETPRHPEFARYRADTAYAAVFAEIAARLRRRDEIIALGR
jgi:tetratricopeptide (TPR) repeat protein